MHRDLAARNVLVFAFDDGDALTMSVKLSHYGLAVGGYNRCKTHGYACLRGCEPHKIGVAWPCCQNVARLEKVKGLRARVHSMTIWLQQCLLNNVGTKMLPNTPRVRH